jgi:unsaturated rhamnogalacturonyl hydrolase
MSLSSRCSRAKYHHRIPIPGILGFLLLPMVGVSHARLLGGAADAVVEQRVVLDCYFNNEWKANASGMPIRYHYVWDDTAGSGFSQLAAIIKRGGGSIDTLCEAPTPAALHRARVYIIVDPDTPEETRSPHYIDQQASNVIEEWVRAGGMLVLLGNDRGKAEFMHMNELAGRFGIHFNEDSRNRVTDRRFEVGTFDSLPDHPLFKGVEKIFIKELSTLRVQEPAHALLVEGHDVIMAYANFGKGGVFAVGDPWFYNEYMDERKLPAGYDNAKAAENLFRWLLSLVSSPHQN